MNPPRTRILLATLALVTSVATAADFYVATNGSDTNSGSLTQPFLTIQRAANVMVAGDTCYIRAGTYRETITPANSGAATLPITYRPYDNEAVTISGADVVTGWSVHSNGIYRAAFTNALGDKDQVFVDGVMMNLARWPNTSLDVSRPTKAYADTGSYAPTNNADGTRTGSYTDAALTQPAGFFNGAKIHFVPSPVWVAQTGTVTDYTPGSLELRWKLLVTGYTYAPKAGDPYFLFGLLSLLDSPGEWFIDTTSNTLYLWPPQSDSTANHTVEAKRRDYGFELSDRSYISLQGLRLFACAVNTSDASRGVVLEGMECLYVSHFSLIDTAGMWDYHMEDTGLILKGTNNTLRNSYIAFSAGNGVTILGASNLVENCVIHDVDYADLDCAAINTGIVSSTSIGHEIRYNTCYNSGRGLLLIRSLAAGKVHHNVLYRSMLRTTDGGAIYTYAHDGRNTEIAYNRVSDSVCAGGGSGIYLDDNSTNFITHHNLIYNTGWGLHYNLASVNMKWFNNTVVAFNNSLHGASTGSQANTEVRNNIFTGGLRVATTNSAEVALSNNLTNTVDPLFISTNALDFRVQSNSPAVDAGMAIPPYTDGYNGAAPDIGAFECGQAPWTAGSSLAAFLPPAGPTSLAGSVSGGGIQLTWKDNSTDEAPVVLDRSPDRRVFTELACLPAHTTNYTDPTVQKGFTYCYRVRAGESPNSNYRSVAVPGRDAFTTIQAESLDAQSGLTVSSVIGSCDDGDWAKYAATDFGSGASNITFRVASGQTLTDLYVEVRLDSTNGTRIANINLLGTGGWDIFRNVSSPVSTVTGVHDLFLVFKGGNGVGNFDYFSFAPVSPLLLPAVPQTATATGIATNQVQVSWALTVAGQDGFKVERSTDNQNFIEIATVSAATNVFTDTGLPSGVRRYYRVRSYNKLGFSDCSPTATAASWTSIEQWRYRYWGATSNSGNAADTANPAGDGIANLMKYALGLDPLSFVTNGLPTAAKSGSLLNYSFTRLRDATDITYRVVTTPRIPTNSWTEIWSSATNAYPSLAPSILQAVPIDITGAPSGFFRLCISRP